MRVMCAFVLVVGLAMPAQAQEAERGWFFSGSFKAATAGGFRTISELGHQEGRRSRRERSKSQPHDKTPQLAKLFRNVPSRAKKRDRSLQCFER